MPRDPRPYVTYPVGYTDHPRLALLSDSAFRVFHLMNDYSREYGLDGKFTFEIAKRWPKRALSELTKGIDDRPLVLVTETGYFMRSYDEHQLTTADIEAMRAQKSAAGAKGGRAKAAARRNAGESVAGASSEGWQNVAKSKSESESQLEDKTDQPHDSEVSHVIPARADLTDSEFLAESASRLGIKSLFRVLVAFEQVVGQIVTDTDIAIAVDVAGAVLDLSTDHVRYPEAYLERTVKDSPETVRTEWTRISTTAPKAVPA